MRDIDELSEAERLFLRQLWLSHPGQLGWNPHHEIHAEVQQLVEDGLVERNVPESGPEGYCYKLAPEAVEELQTVADRVSQQAETN